MVRKTQDETCAQDSESALGHRRFLTIRDIVEDGLGCRQTVWRILKAGDLPYIKLGTSVLIERRDYER